MENNLIDLVVESLAGWGWQVVCLAGAVRRRLGAIDRRGGLSGNGRCGRWV
ncbi:MAG: hypothetical protein AB1453_12125 [Chloroflexota bacterium]